MYKGRGSESNLENAGRVRGVGVGDIGVGSTHGRELKVVGCVKSVTRNWSVRGSLGKMQNVVNFVSL